MTRTNLEILQQEFADHIPLEIIVEVAPIHLAGHCIISRVYPHKGTNRPVAVVLFNGDYRELPAQIARIIEDPLVAAIEAGWNPDEVHVVEAEELPDLDKFAGKKKLKDIGLGDL